MARPQKDPFGVIWREFAFVPGAAVVGYPHDELVRFSGLPHNDDFKVEQRWPISIVLTNMAVIAADLWSLTRLEKHDDASFDELRQWIALTRSLASRFPYAAPYADEMKAIASRVETLQLWPTRFSVTVPSGRDAELNYRFNLMIWGMNEIRKARRMSPKDFWQQGIAVLFSASDRQEFDDAAFEKRISRFEKNLKPDVCADVMFELLCAATMHGPLLADGSRRAGLRMRTRTSKPPARLPKKTRPRPVS